MLEVPILTLEWAKRVFGEKKENKLTYLDRLFMNHQFTLKFKDSEDYLEFDIPKKEFGLFVEEILGENFTIVIVSHMRGDLLTIKLRSPRENNKSLIRTLFEKRGITLKKID
ncbi:hypothetical protein EOM09_01400 [bacterium]|nr:hypothetical protein [bacterium]